MYQMRLFTQDSRGTTRHVCTLHIGARSRFGRNNLQLILWLLSRQHRTERRLDPSDGRLPAPRSDSHPNYPCSASYVNNGMVCTICQTSRSFHALPISANHLISIGGLNAFFPLAISPATRAIQRWIFHRQIGRAIRHSGIDLTSAIAILYWWQYPALRRRLGIHKIIFDVTDDHAALGMNQGHTHYNRFTSKLMSRTATHRDATTIVSAELVNALPQGCGGSL